MSTTSSNTQSIGHRESDLAAGLRLAVMRLRRRLANERHPDNDLSLGAMAALGALAREGDLTPGQLASLERVQPPSMTRLVNALEERGYVARRAHETDGRLVLVSLTETGRATLLADRERRDEWLSDRLDDLTDHERSLLRAAVPLLERIAHHE